MVDIAIIGAGPAGYNGAIKAAELGLSVVLIEKAELGGTCLNRGCIPTKSLLKTAKLVHSLQNAHLFGVDANFTFSMQKIFERKDYVIDKLRKGVEFLIKRSKIVLYNGNASIVDKNNILVQNEEETFQVSARNILIATGSSPSHINIEGIEHTLTSDDVLTQPIKGEDVIIIGGGIIGVEFASFFAMLDKKVTIIEAQQKILPTMDRDISMHLSMQLKKMGVQILTDARVQKIMDKGKSVQVEHRGKTTLVTADAVILSIGRSANINGLGLDNAGVFYDKKIIVDHAFRTNVDNIYAVGDVSSSIQLAHLAEAQAIAAVVSIAGKECDICFETIPSCVYTLNEIASVGNTEQEDNVVVGKSLMGANGKGVIEESTGFVKTFFDKRTKKLLGAVIMCARATDMISELSLALANGLTACEIIKTIHPHPTFSEGVRLSVEEALKKL